MWVIPVFYGKTEIEIENLPNIFKKWLFRQKISSFQHYGRQNKCKKHMGCKHMFTQMFAMQSKVEFANFNFYSIFVTRFDLVNNRFIKIPTAEQFL